MQHRDEIIIKKVISEIEIGLEMLGDTELDAFLSDEKLKRRIIRASGTRISPSSPRNMTIPIRMTASLLTNFQ